MDGIGSINKISGEGSATGQPCKDRLIMPFNAEENTIVFTADSDDETAGTFEISYFENIGTLTINGTDYGVGDQFTLTNNVEYTLIRSSLSSAGKVVANAV